MTDKPVLDYTINDPAAVVCPYCHEPMNLADELSGLLEYDMNCSNCGRPLTLQINTEIQVLAWKPEALQ